MTLKTKIGLLVSTITLLLGLSHICIQRFMVYPEILQLEQSFAKKDMERCVEALSRQQEHLDRILED